MPKEKKGGIKYRNLNHTLIIIRKLLDNKLFH